MLDAGLCRGGVPRFAKQQPLGPTGFLPRALYRYDVELTSVLDLTDARTLGHLDVTSSQLVDDDRALTHHIGEIAHQFGYQAILNASETGVDALLRGLHRESSQADDWTTSWTARG